MLVAAALIAAAGALVAVITASPDLELYRAETAPPTTATTAPAYKSVLEAIAISTEAEASGVAGGAEATKTGPAPARVDMPVAGVDAGAAGDGIPRIELVERRPKARIGSFLVLHNIDLRPRTVLVRVGRELRPVKGLSRRRGRPSSRITVRIAPGRSARLALHTSARWAGLYRGEIAVEVPGLGPAPTQVPVSIVQGPEPVAAPEAVGRADRLEVSWTPPASRGTDGYLVERARGRGAFKPLSKRPSQSLATVDRGLSAGSRYRYRVKAVVRAPARRKGARRRLVGMAGPSTTARIPLAPRSVAIAGTGRNQPGLVTKAGARRAALVVTLPAGLARGEALRVSVNDGRRTVVSERTLRASELKRRRAIVRGLDLRRLRGRRLELGARLVADRIGGPPAVGHARKQPFA